LNTAETRDTGSLLEVKEGDGMIILSRILQIVFIKISAGYNFPRNVDIIRLFGVSMKSGEIRK
jgi:hypothetical protein